MTKTHFTKSIESIGADVDNIRALFGTPSAGAGPAQYGPQKWSEMLLESESFVAEVIAGRRRPADFIEAMGTPLFPALFADGLDRKLYGAYTAAPVNWSRYCRKGTLNDFRKVARFATTGIRNVLSKVGEAEEHQERSQEELKYEYAVEKYEAGFGLTFEAMVNDDLDAFGRLPKDLAQSARDSEEYLATTLFCGPSGPNPTFFTTNSGNLAANNAPLTREALQAAITKLMERTDERGNPIIVTAVELVVGPGLALAAKQIIEAREYRAKDAAGNETIISGNGIDASLTITVNYWLPIVMKTENAKTSWFLFANADTTDRPALEVGFLRGYEAPALYEQIPDMRRIGGRAESPFSFDGGQQRKKIQHIFGGVSVDPRMCIGSNGTGVA